MRTIKIGIRSHIRRRSKALENQVRLYFYTLWFRNWNHPQNRAFLNFHKVLCESFLGICFLGWCTWFLVTLVHDSRTMVQCLGQPRCGLRWLLHSPDITCEAYAAYVFQPSCRAQTYMWSLGNNKCILSNSTTLQSFFSKVSIFLLLLTTKWRNG